MRSVEEFVEQQDEYVKMLEGVAADLRSGKKPANALFIQVYHDNGEVTRIERLDMNFNILSGIGIFEIMKSKLLQMIRESS